MSTILKQTSRQVKAAYRKTDGRVSDSELRRLETLAAADRHAEELREKDKRKREAKRRREDKERKEREARRMNGIGDATQACGWNFTQRRQKDWFRTYFRKDQPKAAPEPNPEDANPFKASHISHPEDTDEQCEIIDDAVHNWGSETEEDTPSKSSGSDDDNVHNEDGGPDDHVRNEVNVVDDARGEEQHCHDAPALEPAPRDSRSYTNGLASNNNLDEVSDIFERTIKEPQSASDVGLDNDDTPWDTDSTDNGNSLAAYNHTLANVRSSPEPADREANPWSTDDIDEESLLAAVQGQTPTSKAFLTAPAAPFGEADEDLPSMDTELLEELLSNSQLARDLATPAHFQPCAALSDSFFSSELDLSAEEISDTEGPLLPAQCPPSEPRVADQHEVHSVAPSRALGDVSPVSPAFDQPLTPPARQAQKRKAGVLNDHTVSSPKERKEPTARRTSTENSMLPPSKPATSKIDRSFHHGPHESRFAVYGLSTQLIQDAAFDDLDF